MTNSFPDAPRVANPLFLLFFDRSPFFGLFAFNWLALGSRFCGLFCLAAGEAVGCSKPAWASVIPMRETVVPHTAHCPLVMGLPFTVKLATGLTISRFCLHFIQYASKNNSSCTFFKNAPIIPQAFLPAARAGNALYKFTILIEVNRFSSFELRRIPFP